MRDFHGLKVWIKAHQLVLDVYRASAYYPKNETFSLTSQTRRAATSVAANIAEGCGRNSESDFARFLQIAMGSASELEYELLLARDLGFLEIAVHGKLDGDITEVKKMLASLIRKLRGEGK